MKTTIALVMGTLLLGSPVISLACKKGEHGEKAEAGSKTDPKKDTSKETRKG